MNVYQDDVHCALQSGEKSWFQNIIISKSSLALVQMYFDLEILFEDPSLLCINKPAGLMSIRDGYDPSLPYVSRLLQPRFGRLWIVHRLDRETSGVFLMARTPESHKILNNAFESRTVHKTYHAIVIGRPGWDEYLADLPLKINADRHHRTLVHPMGGKPAQTRFRVINSDGKYSLLEACPLSGYTHQIRAHLLALGFPILADSLYALPARLSEEKLGSFSMIDRLALHAYKLDFQHPLTGIDLDLIADYPEDFNHALISLSLAPKHNFH